MITFWLHRWADENVLKYLQDVIVFSIDFIKFCLHQNHVLKMSSGWSVCSSQILGISQCKYKLYYRTFEIVKGVSIGKRAHKVTNGRGGNIWLCCNLSGAVVLNV